MGGIDEHAADPLVRRHDYEVLSDGKPLFVREICPASPGSREFLLFVHGVTFPSSVDFDLPIEGYSVTGHLARQGVNCCIFDIRGYGRSHKPARGEPIGMPERARDLSAVYDALVQRHAPSAVVLVGLSSGCNTIAEFLRTYKAAPRSAVFIGPCYLLNPEMKLAVQRVRLIRFFQALIGRRGNVYVSVSSRLLVRRLYAGEEAFIDKSVFDRFVAMAIAMTCPGARGLRAPLLSFPDPKRSWRLWDPMFDASAITCPLLVLRGGTDEFCCERTAESLVRDAGDEARLVTFKDRKHDIHLYRDHRDFFDTIHRFVTRQQ
jgi:alpha-beta hydrolase superfamily lysophospholipase